MAWHIFSCISPICGPGSHAPSSPPADAWASCRYKDRTPRRSSPAIRSETAGRSEVPHRHPTMTGMPPHLPAPPVSAPPRSAPQQDEPTHELLLGAEIRVFEQTVYPIPPGPAAEPEPPPAAVASPATWP